MTFVIVMTYYKKKNLNPENLRMLKIRNHIRKNEKWQIISNMIGTDVLHTQGGERAWWLQYVIYDVWLHKLCINLKYSDLFHLR